MGADFLFKIVRAILSLKEDPSHHPQSKNSKSRGKRHHKEVYRSGSGESYAEGMENGETGGRVI